MTWELLKNPTNGEFYIDDVARGGSVKPRTVAAVEKKHRKKEAFNQELLLSLSLTKSAVSSILVYSVG